MPDRNHPAPGAAVLKLIRLHRQHQPLLLVDSDIEDVHAGNIEHRIGPLILKAPTPSIDDQSARCRPVVTHAQIRRALFPHRALAEDNVFDRRILAARGLDP
jgi:hypothetical protein